MVYQYKNGCHLEEPQSGELGINGYLKILSPFRCAQGLRMTDFFIKIQTRVILRSHKVASSESLFLCFLYVGSK
jgi:hypothetical protein